MVISTHTPNIYCQQYSAIMSTTCPSIHVVITNNYYMYIRCMLPKPSRNLCVLCALQTCFYIVNVCIYCTCTCIYIYIYMYSIAKYLGHHLPGLAVPVATCIGRALAVVDSSPAKDSSSVFFSSTVCFVCTIVLYSSVHYFGIVIYTCRSVLEASASDKLVTAHIYRYC